MSGPALRHPTTKDGCRVGGTVLQAVYLWERPQDGLRSHAQPGAGTLREEDEFSARKYSWVGGWQVRLKGGMQAKVSMTEVERAK